MRLYDGINRAADAIASTRAALEAARSSGNADRVRQLQGLIGAGGGGFGGGDGGAPTLTRVSGTLTQLFGLVEDADRLPTTAVRSAADAALRELASLAARADAMR